MTTKIARWLRLTPEEYAAVAALATQERRSIASMLVVLVMEAIAARAAKGST